VHYSRAGLLQVQRIVRVPWRDATHLPDVVMIPEDPAVALFTSGSATTQVGQASVVTDEDGSRRVTVVMAPGTTAEMLLQDGTRKPLTDMHLRATEYTVGADGPARMPGELPPRTGYTYAAELSLDEARDAGAVGVEFSKPIVVYLDNFLEFPAGTEVPAGYYDRVAGQWRGEPNGRVLTLLSASEVDADGDGKPDTAAALAALGIGTDELVAVAPLLAAGRSYWRMPAAHLSPWDFNMPFKCRLNSGIPECIAPDVDQKTSRCSACQTTEVGSIIRCQDQALGEAIPIAGTQYSLSYWSDRARTGSYKQAHRHQQRPAASDEPRLHDPEGLDCGTGARAELRTRLEPVVPVRVGRQGRLWASHPGQQAADHPHRLHV